MSVTARAIGAAGIEFFGFALVVAVRRLLAMPPGLTLTADGLVARGNALALARAVGRRRAGHRVLV